MNQEKKKSVAIIGGGVAGLVAARHFSDLSYPTTVTLFEQTDSLGGTWVYSDNTHLDEYGLPVHSSMYKSLRTNLPKEAMMFPDFPHTKQSGVSYLSAKDVLQYLNDYADHFNIRKCTKFRHHIRAVKPYGSQWKIQVVDLKANKEKTNIFDAVVIANGHNSKPRYPSINGIKNFKGIQIHSHMYREAAPFRNKKVLIIGAGPSGLDMTFEISSVTDHVVLSHHTDYASKVGFPSKVVLKNDVGKILEDGTVVFKDKTCFHFDIIAYATGYLYTYPFLSKDCGIIVEDNYVSPLFKSVININYPTMALLALLRHTPTFYMTDLQVRFFLQTLLKPQLLPSKEIMLRELHVDESLKMANGIRKQDFHMVGDDNENYMKDLSRISGVQPMPSILLRIYFHGYQKIFSEFKSFRNNFYKIIDHDKFTVVDLREIQTQPLQRIHSNPSCRCGPLLSRKL